MLLTTAAIQASLWISVCLNLQHEPASSILMVPQLWALLYAFFSLPVCAEFCWNSASAGCSLLRSTLLLWNSLGHMQWRIFDFTTPAWCSCLCQGLWKSSPWQPHTHTLHKQHKEQLSSLHSMSKGCKSERTVSLDMFLKKMAPSTHLDTFPIMPSSFYLFSFIPIMLKN